MTRALFVRIYAALVVTVLGGVLAMGAWELARRRPGDDGWVEASATAPGAVQSAFAGAEGEHAALQQIRRELDVDARLYAIAEAPLGVQRRLEHGHPAVPRRADGPELWVPVDATRAVRLRPASAPRIPLPILIASLFLVSGAAIAWQLRPLDRDLRALGDAAERFGGGDLSTRSALPAGSAVADLGGRFDAMAERIGVLVRSRQDMLLAVSHELRTPLQRLRFGVDALDDGGRPEAIELIQRDIDALDALVGELLAWGKVDAQAVRREDIDLRALVAPLAEDAARLRPGITLDLRGEGRARLDPALARRALSSLLANAARYGQRQIRVTVAPGAVHIEDDGPGIPVDQRAHVREPFARLDAARDRDAGGVGLGLALADRVCKAHGGQLDLEDSDLGGLLARLTFPDAP